MRGDITEIKRTLDKQDAEKTEEVAAGVTPEKPQDAAEAAVSPEPTTLDVFGAEFGSSGTVSQGAVEVDEEQKE